MLNGIKTFGRFLSIFLSALLLYANVSAQPDNTAFGNNTAGVSLFSVKAEPLIDSPPINHLFGKPALVILFQPNCGYCKAQMRNVQAFVGQNRKYQTFAVSEYGSKRALERMLRQGNIDIPAYKSSPSLLRFLGNPRGSPHTFLIDRYGRVIIAARGTQTIAQITTFVRLAESSRE